MMRQFKGMVVMVSTFSMCYNSWDNDDVRKLQLIMTNIHPKSHNTKFSSVPIHPQGTHAQSLTFKIHGHCFCLCLNPHNYSKWTSLHIFWSLTFVDHMHANFSLLENSHELIGCRDQQPKWPPNLWTTVSP